MHKVVINDSYYEFSLSWAAVEYLARHGHKAAYIVFEKFKDNPPNRGFLKKISRHNKLLVQAVEELGQAAAGPRAQLRIEEISGNQYYIDPDTEGGETLYEPEDFHFIVID